MVIRIFMTFYIILNFTKLIYKQDDTTATFYKALGNTELEEQKHYYKESGVAPFYYLKKLHDGEHVYFPCLSTSKQCEQANEQAGK